MIEYILIGIMYVAFGLAIACREAEREPRIAIERLFVVFLVWPFWLLALGVNDLVYGNFTKNPRTIQEIQRDNKCNFIITFTRAVKEEEKAQVRTACIKAVRELGFEVNDNNIIIQDLRIIFPPPSE